MRRALLTAVALVIAGCSVSDVDIGVPTSLATVSAPSDSATSVTVVEAPPGFPVAVDSAAGPITLDEPPTAIVSLSPTATEVLFAVGAGDQVTAVDEYSYFPPEAPVTDLSGLTPNLEAIAGYQPDLVVVSDDIDGIVEALDSVGIPTIWLPAVSEVEHVYGQIELVGQVTGHREEADRLIASMRAELSEVTAAASAAQDGESLTYYHELDPSFFTVTSSTFIGHVYSLFGLVNIADAADPTGSGYPQLSVEYILEQDPDLIFVTDCCGDSVDSIAARPGWAELSAVENGSVVIVNSDVSSRWGPRIVDFAGEISAAVRDATG